MPRYFLELGYRGEHFSGFQVQHNAVTIQSEMERALQVFFRENIALTGSSRTDAGVHALQNYFHFDLEKSFPQEAIYNLNAILHKDIVVRSVREVKSDAHCRFHATARLYKYYIYPSKNPFLQDRALYYPYTVNRELLDQCAGLVKQNQNFLAFSKRNTQVKTFQCQIEESRWEQEGDCLVYHVQANRFLRGMVRGLVGTMLRVARGSTSLNEFAALLSGGDPSSADFSAPAKGLFLMQVTYPEGLFVNSDYYYCEHFYKLF